MEKHIYGICKYQSQAISGTLSILSFRFRG